MKATNWKFARSSGVAREVLEAQAKAGVQAIEISLGKGMYPALDFKKAKQDADACGIELWSFHLPFSPFAEMNPSSTNSALREYTVNLFSYYINKAADIGCKVITIHPSGEPIPDEERTEQMKCSKDSLFKLAEVSKQNGVILAVEDLPRTCLGHTSDEILELISVHDNLKVCFDTNHLLFEKNVDFIKKCGEHIVTTHFSDYDFLNERHWMPYEGKNDWISIITALEEVGYSGPLLFELGLVTPEELERPRELTYDDFKIVYDALVNKTTVSPLGKPNPELIYNKVFTKTPLF